uniref:HMG box domain-containing protein n=1 Tax=Lotharella globosa TaxID=91324 RepID=A0A6V3Q2F7_9EUKA
MTAYNFFQLTEMKRCEKVEGSATLSHSHGMAKNISRLWRKLHPTKRKEFEARAHEDKIRYQRENSVYLNALRANFRPETKSPMFLPRSYTYTPTMNPSLAGCMSPSVVASFSTSPTQGQQRTTAPPSSVQSPMSPPQMISNPVLVYNQKQQPWSHHYHKQQLLMRQQQECQEQCRQQLQLYHMRQQHLFRPVTVRKLPGMEYLQQRHTQLSAVSHSNTPMMTSCTPSEQQPRRQQHQERLQQKQNFNHQQQQLLGQNLKFPQQHQQLLRQNQNFYRQQHQLLRQRQSFHQQQQQQLHHQECTPHRPHFQQQQQTRQQHVTVQSTPVLDSSKMRQSFSVEMRPRLWMGSREAWNVAHVGNVGSVGNLGNVGNSENAGNAVNPGSVGNFGEAGNVRHVGNTGNAGVSAVAAVGGGAGVVDIGTPRHPSMHISTPFISETPTPLSVSHLERAPHKIVREASLEQGAGSSTQNNAMPLLTKDQIGQCNLTSTHQQSMSSAKLEKLPFEPQLHPLLRNIQRIVKPVSSLISDSNAPQQEQSHQQKQQQSDSHLEQLPSPQDVTWIMTPDVAKDLARQVLANHAGKMVTKTLQVKRENFVEEAELKAKHKEEETEGVKASDTGDAREAADENALKNVCCNKLQTEVVLSPDPSSPLIEPLPQRLGLKTRTFADACLVDLTKKRTDNFS